MCFLTCVAFYYYISVISHYNSSQSEFQQIHYSYSYSYSLSLQRSGLGAHLALQASTRGRRTGNPRSEWSFVNIFGYHQLFFTAIALYLREEQLHEVHSTSNNQPTFTLLLLQCSNFYYLLKYSLRQLKRHTIGISPPPIPFLFHTLHNLLIRPSRYSISTRARRQFTYNIPSLSHLSIFVLFFSPPISTLP